MTIAPRISCRWCSISPSSDDAGEWRTDEMQPTSGLKKSFEVRLSPPSSEEELVVPPQREGGVIHSGTRIGCRWGSPTHHTPLSILLPPSYITSSPSDLAMYPEGVPLCITPASLRSKATREAGDTPRPVTTEPRRGSISSPTHLPSLSIKIHKSIHYTLN